MSDNETLNVNKVRQIHQELGHYPEQHLGVYPAQPLGTDLQPEPGKFEPEDESA
jgi:hypothetical protein